MNDFVKEKIIYYMNNMNYNSYINIGFGIDKNFIRPMGVSMTSIVKNNPNENIIFHIFIDTIDFISLNLLEKFAKQYNIAMIIYIINPNIFNKLPSTTHFAKATYNRLLMPKILNNIVDRLIYIDADIQCFGSLSNLMKLDLKNNIVAVVGDLKYVREKQIKLLSLKSNQYFNAGFMYIDVKKWNEENISDKVIKVSFDNVGNLPWLDQDALNIILDNKCLYLDKKYDFLLNMKHKKRKVPENVIFVHYVGRYKPWTKWCLHPFKKHFLSVSKESLWRNIPLIEPVNYKSMKMMGRSSFLYGKYINAFYWYLKYAVYKIKSKL